MRSQQEIEKRLRELHGTRIEKAMGGLRTYQDAQSLLWTLGYDDPRPFPRDQTVPETVDVSDYVDVDE